MRPETHLLGTNEARKPAPVTRLRTDLTFLYYLEELKTTKAAWEHYNGGE